MCRKSIGADRFFSSVIVLRISIVGEKKELIWRFSLSLSERYADEASVAGLERIQARNCLVFT
jgi:hypothetical protein